MIPVPARAALGLVGLGAAFVAGTVVESRAYLLRRYELPVLAPGSRSLRVLHLSDLHLTPWQRREREWVRGLAALEPDLVVDTGDNLAHVDAVPAVLDALAPLLERARGVRAGVQRLLRAGAEEPGPLPAAATAGRSG